MSTSGWKSFLTQLHARGDYATRPTCVERVVLKGVKRQHQVSDRFDSVKEGDKSVGTLLIVQGAVRVDVLTIERLLLCSENGRFPFFLFFGVLMVCMLKQNTASTTLLSYCREQSR